MRLLVCFLKSVVESKQGQKACHGANTTRAAKCFILRTAWCALDDQPSPRKALRHIPLPLGGKAKLQHGLWVDSHFPADAKRYSEFQERFARRVFGGLVS